jgi:hypothetical protein
VIHVDRSRVAAPSELVATAEREVPRLREAFAQTAGASERVEFRSAPWISVKPMLDELFAGKCVWTGVEFLSMLSDTPLATGAPP